LTPALGGPVFAFGYGEAWRRAWRTDVGEGYSSPVVAGGRVFVHSRRDPEDVVSAIDLASGKVAWQQKYATFNKNQYAVQMAKGPHATPLVLGNRIITLGAMGVLSAWNTQTGTLLWRKDFSTDVDTSKLFTGTAASPLAEGGSVIVQVGSDVHGGRVMALDPQSGAERWTWRGKRPGYASEGRTGNHASILLTPANVLLLTNDGDLVVARRSSDGFAEERRYDVADSETWAVPVLLRDGLIVGDATGVMRLTSS
jgi:outer membrane protein assembly factor BamB